VSTKPLPRILYIEDNAEARSLVGRLMIGRYSMLEANDPIVGLELAKQTQPDLILLDMNLPNMNGLDVARRLLGILKPGTPILALSADSDPEMCARAIAGGFSGFVNKPIDIDMFYETLNSFLRDKPENEKSEKPANIITTSGSLQHRGVRLSALK
jgi:CheY-like chemotaxis protein